MVHPVRAEPDACLHRYPLASRKMSMASDWNLERTERSRAVLRALKFIGSRNQWASDTVGRSYYPLICHLLPLGRIRWGTYEDRLALRGGDVRDLLPPQLQELYTCFNSDGVQFIDNPRLRWMDHAICISWFRSGGVEVRTRLKGSGGLGIVQLVEEIIPFLGRSAGTVLGVSPPILVDLTLYERRKGMISSPPDDNAHLRLALAEDDHEKRISLVPTVIDDPEEFASGWSSHAERIFHQIAQAYGYPAHPRYPKQPTPHSRPEGLPEEAR